MKICVAICEFNPLHNGHVKFLRNCRELTGCDTVIAVMSGNFTQRGDIAVLSKQERSRHAVIAGADCVLELPAVFAVSPSEIFCSGAINILKSIPDAAYLCFGSELGKADSFIEGAKFFNEEPKEYKKAVKELLDKGEPLPKAREEALRLSGFESFAGLIASPNNILGLEYTKALIKSKAAAEIVTYKREGDYNDGDLSQSGISASAVRNNLGNKKLLLKHVPEYVVADLPERMPDAGDLMFYSLLTKSKEELKEIMDVSEGLENRIASSLKTSENFELFMESLKTKRYPLSRLKRVALASLLGIKAAFVRSALEKKLYLKVLAVKDDRQDILSHLKNSDAPLLTRKGDVNALNKFQRSCHDSDVLAGDIYGLITKKKYNEHFMQIISGRK